MTINVDSKIVLVELEGTYATDPTPTGADAVLTKNFSISPIEGGSVQRSLDRPGHGNEQAIHVGSHQMCEFEMELTGSGSAVDAPPPWSKVIRACGMAEAISAATSVTYAPVSSSFESSTLYFHHDGNFHKLTGVRGSWALAISALQIPVLRFRLVGLWNDPAATADPTPTYATVVPVPVSNAETSFSLHGVSSVMHSLNLDAKLTVPHRDLVNQNNVIISGRDLGGDVTIDEPALGTKNWFTTIKANTQGVLNCVHGTTAFNIVTINAPLTQALNASKGNQDGISTLQLGIICSPSGTGDDDISIVTT